MTSSEVTMEIDISATGLLQKYNALKEWLGKYIADGLIVAFSGGVDSGFLLWAAEEARKKYGGKVVALTTNSESMPSHDRQDVRNFVAAVGVRHIWRNRALRSKIPNT